MKKQMHKILCYLFVIALFIGLVGCGVTGGRTEVSGATSLPGDGDATTSTSMNWDQLLDSDDDQSGNQGGTTVRGQTGKEKTRKTATTTEGKRVVTTVPKVSSDEFPWPKFNFTNKTLTILGRSSIPDKYSSSPAGKLLKEKYGITIKEIHSDWWGIDGKFQSMYAAGNAPDLLYYKLYDSQLQGMALKGMLREVEDYIDLNNKVLWGDLKSAYKQTMFNGHYYLLMDWISEGPWIFYNKKIFRDFGVKDLWETYKADPSAWTWTKMGELAKKLTDSKTGQVGLATDDGMAFFHTVGQTFGEYGVTRDKVKSNAKNAAFARAADFIANGRTEGWVDTAIHGEEDKFNAEQVAMAMLIGDIPLGCTEILKRGDLGCVPFPRDPESKTFWNYKQIGGFYMPKKSANPEAGVAFVICERYYEMTNEGIEEVRNKRLADGWSEELIYQYSEPDRIGKPIIDMAQNLGYFNVWNFLMHNHSWASTFMGETQDTLNAHLDGIYAGQ